MKHLVFTLILVGSSLAFAEKDYEIVKKATTAVEEDSSAFHRINKQYEIGAQIFGVGPSVLGTQGLYFAYKLDRNSSIIAEVTSGSLGGGSNGAFDTEYKITGKSFGVHYKRFSGNSFYWRAGLDYRTINYKHTYDKTPYYEHSEFDGQSLAGNFQIGNQWQWENFTLGCDWVGVSLPVTSSSSNETVAVSGAGSLSFEKNRLEDDKKILIKNGHLNLLRFYLGWAF